MAVAGRKTWTRERLTSSDLQNFLQDQTIMSFVSDSARTTALPVAARKLGMITWRDELGGVYETWTGSAWKIVAMLNPPFIRGTLARSDGSATVNGPNAFTSLMCTPVAADTVGTWTTYNDANGVGHTCAIPGVYDVSVYCPTDIVGSRTEEILLLGTLALNLGLSGSPGGSGGTFGGASGSTQVRAPSGISAAFRYANYSASVAGSIRTGTRYAIAWSRPA